MNYEVYVVSYDNAIVYVGEGKAGRHRHVNSGISHVFNLNRLYFERGKMDVEITYLPTKEEAEELELFLIAELKPFFNNRDAKNNKGKNAGMVYYEFLECVGEDVDPYEKRIVREAKETVDTTRKHQFYIDSLSDVVQHINDRIANVEADNVVKRAELKFVQKQLDDSVMSMSKEEYVRYLHRLGHTQKSIADFYSVDIRTIRNWLKRKANEPS